MLVWSGGCTCAPSGSVPDPDTTSTTTTDTTTTTTSDLPCGTDCSETQTLPCTIAVCNTGQVLGPLNTCVVVPAETGTPCDDGKFCTVDDYCDDAKCVGGSQNGCGNPSSPCLSVVCYEESKSCDVTPVNDGASCTPKDLCQVDGVCALGECIGQAKDCSFSALNECNKVGCDPATGKCVGTPDPEKDDDPCFLTGEPCSDNKTCKAGFCGGGVPKDCSALDAGCEIGACDPDTGICNAMAAPVGTVCTEGIHECDVGKCDDKRLCVASAAPNGGACNDHNACTKNDACMTGECNGASIAGCVLYLHEGFETCPAGWTFGGDWECGTPDNVGPLEAHTGTGVIATQVAGNYHVNQSFTMAVADSPPIDLNQAVSPVLSFWAWDHTEGGSFDGWNIKISTNGGQTFTTVSTVTPPYDLNILGQAAWGGDHSAQGWQIHTADLTAYKGHTVILRFAFRSDGATVFPGVYLDDIDIAEPLQSPLFITTDSLPNDYVDMTYAQQITRVGGTPGATWSIKPGGVNDAWLTIDPATGMLVGTPTDAEIGPVSVTVHVEEPTFPSNFMDKTFELNVVKAAYYTSFEGTCPDGWTLTGDWECGVPSSVGPLTAYSGVQCIATQIDAFYSDAMTFSGTTATSPDIDLAGLVNPQLSFRAWIDTEGGTYDGFNLLVSNDGGMTYTVFNGVLPSYSLAIAGQLAWGGHQQALGWQLMQADLSPYAGQTIRLRFAFRSDNSANYAGVYIDEFLVN